MTPVRIILNLLDTATPSLQQCEEVVEIVRRYPYFTAAAAAAVGRGAAGIDTMVLRQLSAAASLGAPDRMALYQLSEPTAAALSSFYPPREVPKVTTESAIDTFLDNYGEPIDPKEQALLEKLIFNPVADYSMVLQHEQGDEAPKVVDRQDQLLDAFLARTGESHIDPLTAEIDYTADTEVIESGKKRSEDAPNRLSDHTSNQSQSSSLLSESLARIYIKRGRYDKAYEIIHNLSLNFPEKSIYFADQLRFLQKLMVNSKYSNPQK